MIKRRKYHNKCPICGRSTHRKSKYCIFHASAEEKTEGEFKKVLKKYVEKIEKEDGDYNFKEFIFVGDIDFKKDLKVNTFKNANFEKAIFEGYTKFESVGFWVGSNFGGAIFKKDTIFDTVFFSEETIFKSVIFEKAAKFRKVSFDEGGALFEEATFKGCAVFFDTTFKGEAIFVRVAFEKDTLFEKVNFLRSANFTKADFAGCAVFWELNLGMFANFVGVTFKGETEFNLKLYQIDGLILSKIKVFSGIKLFIHVKNRNKKSIISFEGAFFENAYLNIPLAKEVFIDFKNALIRNTKIKKRQIDNHILQEKEKKFTEAKEIYLLLKNNFHSIGQYDDESWAFTREKDMERMSKSFCSLLSKYEKYSLFKKILMQSSILKRVIIKSKIFSKWLFSKKAIEWFNLSVSNFIYQYGENPWRVIRFSFIIIFSFAFILNIYGIVNSDRTNLIIEFIKESQGDEYTLKYLGPILGSFLNCLYFSVVTFTTLGYGDFQPAVGLSRFFVSLESIIGAITMALFVYTFARRTGGR